MLRHKNSDSESYNYRREAFYDYSGIFSYHSNIMCLHKKKNDTIYMGYSHNNPKDT